MLLKVRKILFFLIVFSLSFQVGFHFWPDFSYVNGVRIDYLSPTLYFLDLLIIPFIILSLYEIRKEKLNIVVPPFLKIIILLFILDLIINIFISRSPGAHILGIVRIIEFSLFALSVAFLFKKNDIKFFVDSIGISAVISSVLAFWQFAIQSSVGGLWYFLGERTFNIITVGISTVNLDRQLLRPYAAFPHPNVLAFFLLISLVFLIYRIRFEKKLNERVFIAGCLAVTSLTLLITFSRTSILLAISFLFYELFSKTKGNVRLTILFLSGSIPLLIGALFPNFLFRGFDFRQELIEQATKIFIENPYFGIGLNNFFVYQTSFIKSISPIIFQPVHNIFLLALLSLGILGFWIFPASFYYAVKSAIKKSKSKNIEVSSFYKTILFLLIAIITVGLFDHFFLTLEQGQIMLALILGLSFARINSSNISPKKI